MLKYLGWAILELCMFLLIGLGILLALLPAACFMIGFAGQEHADYKRTLLRAELGKRWRDRNRAKSQRLCGKRPN